MKDFTKILILMSFLIIIPFTGYSQGYIGTFSVTYDNPAPPASDELGPTTSSEGRLNFLDATTFGTPAGGALNVRAIFTNTRYPSDLPNTTAQNRSDVPDFGLNFGITTTADQSSKMYSAQDRLQGINSFYEVQTNYYDPGTGGTLNRFDLQTFNMLTVTEGLNDDEEPTNGTYTMGTLTFNFNRPVDNPVLHLSGLGGFFIGTAIPSVLFPTQQYQISYTTELLCTSHTIEILEGTSNLSESGNRLTNIWEFNPNSDDFGVKADEGGTGSIRVNGNNITQVVFTVFMKGKPQLDALGMPVDGQDRWTSYDGPQPGVLGPNFDQSQSYAGDQYDIGWTIETFDFGGSVVLDYNINGNTAAENSPDGSFTGSTYNSGLPNYEPLFAILVDGEGKVAQVVPVDASDGTFDFTSVIGDDYHVQLSIINLAIGSMAPGTATLPSAYVTSEEEFLSGGSDGNENSVTNDFLVNSTSVNQINDGNLILGLRSTTSLPITISELISIEGEDCVSELRWMTEAEVNASFIDIEISEDGDRFVKAGSVQAKGSGSEYTYAVNTSNGFKFARLKMHDLDGTITYSNTIRLNSECNVPTNTFSLTPNPVQFGTSLRVKYIAKDELASFYVVDITGKLVKKITEKGDSEFEKTFELSTDDLQPGIYFLNMEGEKTKKFIVTR